MLQLATLFARLEDLSLPLTNPVLKFSLILFIILFAPILLNKVKIPHLIGLIIAGAIIGPNGFNLMIRGDSIVLFGTVGLLYIMFLAGLEIDLADFKKNSKKSLVFGFYTFSIPMILGVLSSYYILNFSMMSSVLLASMFASHTLIAYPIASKLGVIKNRAVNITVGGTMITDTLALLVLAAIVGLTSGTADSEFWLTLSISVLVFGAIVWFIFPIIARWFFKRFHDSISQYIFVLAMVFLGAFLAEAAGIEAIIGAFLAGLALNRLIPHTSPLMNRIEFVGNALFIPFFLIGVGMLIDFRIFFQGLETIKVAITMIVIATSAKFLAAWLTQKTFGFSRDERRMIFGLSNAQAAATLAAVLIGYNIILNKEAVEAAALIGKVVAPERLLNDQVLNGTILMILVTCTIASIVTQKGAQNLALLENTSSENNQSESDERILIPLANEETSEELVNLSIIIKSKNNHKGLYALNVISNNSDNNNSERKAQELLTKVSKVAAASDNELNALIRYDLNVSNGISGVIKEHKITDLILGLHEKRGISDNFLGNLTEGVLSKCNTTTLIYKAHQPISTIKRHLVVVPQKAEREIGFPFWVIKIWNIAKNTGARVIFYATEETIIVLQAFLKTNPIEAEFNTFEDWNDFLIISKDLKPTDNLHIILSRKDYPSYHNAMSRLPTYLNKYFTNNSFIIIYPMQAGVDDNNTVIFHNASVNEPFEKLEALGKSIAKIFK